MGDSTKMCSVPGCDRKVLARGWCNLHYLRWRTHGDALFERPSVCSVAGCDRAVKSRGYCEAHYLRLRRHGAIDDQRAAPVRTVTLVHAEACSVAGCDERYYASGLCRRHYDRTRQAGDPLAPDRRTTYDPLSDEFWDQLDRSAGPGGCWPWLHSRSPDGYGRLTYGRRTIRAHRIAYTLAYGPVPAGGYVLHRCDNPPCCNPAHLFLGDQAANMADMKAKGRGRGGNQPGERNNLAKLTAVQVADMRSRYPAETQAALAAEYGVGASAVSRIISGVRWG